MSAAVMTATTPGAAATAARSRRSMVPCARALMPTATCRRSRGSGMSSVYSARPLTCRWPLSWGIARPTVRRLRGAVRRSPSMRIQPRRDTGSGALDVETPQQVLRHLAPVGVARAHVGYRCEVVVHRRHGAFDRVLVPVLADESLLGSGGALRYGRHTAAGD